VSPTRKKKTATVWLVGAGPADPGLLTVRAAEVLAEAEVVIGHPVAHAALLDGLPEETERLDSSALDADALAKAAVTAARDGKTVVRLYAGDPFVGCRGSDFAVALTKAKVPFEVVPGLSAAFAVPSYAGIALTDRAHRAVTVVDLGADEPQWSKLAGAGGTLVVLGVEGRIAGVVESLLAAGLAETTSAAVTSAGTTTSQQTVSGPLGEIAKLATGFDRTLPALLVVGDVVRSRDKLSWFESKPLFGWRVLVPRTKEQAGALSEQLRAYGAVPVEVPTIAVEPPRTPATLDRAIQGLFSGRYLWCAFTSTNAVKAIRERFEEYGLDARAFAGVKVAAVGEQTSAALAAWGIKADLVPAGEQSSEGLLAVWPPFDDVLDPIDRVFLPRADIATETLVAGLKERGWEVDDVTAYRTVRAAPPPAAIREAIKSGGFDAVLFTSSSTVRNLVGIAGKPHAKTVVAVIGPQTAATAEEHGLRVDVLAPAPSVTELVEALADHAVALREAAASAPPAPPKRPAKKTVANAPSATATTKRVPAKA
jgi:uroporphyrinogen III methyltransferase/synthase